MSAGKNEESPWPSSQEASPDKAALDFLSVIADNPLTQKKAHIAFTDVSAGISRASLSSFKKNVP